MQRLAGSQVNHDVEYPAVVIFSKKKRTFFGSLEQVIKYIFPYRRKGQPTDLSLSDGLPSLPSRDLFLPCRRPPSVLSGAPAAQSEVPCDLSRFPGTVIG
jgi:hypothetical protein